MEENIPKVFISYSHDSKEFQDKILHFSNKLRKEGIDATIDQYVDSPREGWPKWMEKNIQEADYVLVICTENYKLKVSGGVSGNGINWETSIVYQHLYNSGSKNEKFIPVITGDGKFDDILTPLQGSTFYDMDNEDEYNSLYWYLRGVKKEKPELGKLRELPEIERKTIFVSGLIKPNLWSKAKWKNVPLFLFSDAKPVPPVLSIIFENIEFGKEIFRNLIDKIGKEDINERLRISIVEGDVPNQQFGYFLLIGENLSATNNVIENNTNAEVEYIIIQQQIHRMKPPVDSIILNKFKEEFQKHGCFFIAPAKVIHDEKNGKGYQVEMEYSILKRNIDFRNYVEINDPNDPDIILKNENLLENKF